MLFHYGCKVNKYITLEKRFACIMIKIEPKNEGCTCRKVLFQGGLTILL